MVVVVVVVVFFFFFFFRSDFSQNFFMAIIGIAAKSSHFRDFPVGKTHFWSQFLKTLMGRLVVCLGACLILPALVITTSCLFGHLLVVCGIISLSSNDHFREKLLVGFAANMLIAFCGLVVFCQLTTPRGTALSVNGNHEADQLITRLGADSNKRRKVKQ